MKETILIIEDEEDILALLSSLLEGEGYHIITACNGRKGIEQFEEHSPDIIITDVRMPVMDGIEVLREIKAKEPYLRVPRSESQGHRQYGRRLFPAGCSG